jgi:transposase
MRATRTVLRKLVELALQLFSRVFLKDLETQCLQARHSIRRRLIIQRVSATNLLGRQIEQFGGRYQATHAQGELRRRVQAEIKRIFRDEPLSLTAELRYLLEHCERLQEHQRGIDRDLANYAANNDVCLRLMEIPGVGPLCALNFYAAIGDPHRFERTGDVGNYFGLTPRLHQSGLFHRMGRISKMGNRSMRTLLVQSALTFMRSVRKRPSELGHQYRSAERERAR